MPKPSLRTRSRKRRDIRLPGGRRTIHYKREKDETARCDRCGRRLHGTPRLNPSKLKKLPSSKRTVRRPYGGHLCHKCLQGLLKKAVGGV